MREFFWFIILFGVLAAKIILLGGMSPEEHEGATTLSWILVAATLTAIFALTMRVTIEMMSAYIKCRELNSVIKKLEEWKK